jgi:hypothetical protein
MQQFLADPPDTATPNGTVHLLVRASRGDMLSPRSTNYLFEVMEATRTGKGRLKGVLPPNTPVAHKTGTTATIKGLNGATNDVGIILPRRANEIAIAVYIKGSTRNEEIRDSVIAHPQKQLTIDGRHSLLLGQQSRVRLLRFFSPARRLKPVLISFEPLLVFSASFRSRFCFGWIIFDRRQPHPCTSFI